MAKNLETINFTLDEIVSCMDAGCSFAALCQLIEIMDKCPSFGKTLFECGTCRHAIGDIESIKEIVPSKTTERIDPDGLAATLIIFGPVFMNRLMFDGANGGQVTLESKKR